MPRSDNAPPTLTHSSRCRKLALAGQRRGRHSFRGSERSSVAEGLDRVRVTRTPGRDFPDIAFDPMILANLSSQPSNGASTPKGVLVSCPRNNFTHAGSSDRMLLE